MLDPLIHATAWRVRPSSSTCSGTSLASRSWLPPTTPANAALRATGETRRFKGPPGGPLANR